MEEPMTTGSTAVPVQECRDRASRGNGFVIGLVAGGVVGAGLGWLLAPRVSELSRQTADSFRSLGAAASDRYRDTSARVAAVVEGLAEKGEDLRDQVSDAVIHGARAVEQGAEQMKSGR